MALRSKWLAVGLVPVAAAIAVAAIVFGGAGGTSGTADSGRDRLSRPTPAHDDAHRPEDRHVAAGPIHFTDVTSASGIEFVHSSGTSDEKPFPAANGSGAAALDYDLDGWYDLYFLTGTPFPIDLSRAAPHNMFYRNRGGWQFEDVTDETGLGWNGYSTGVAVGDYDADGFPDVFVGCFGPNRLYRNRGDGTFVDVSQQAGVDDPRWATSAAFLDYDRDGLLDLYVCHYARWTLETNQYCGSRERGVRVYCNPRTVDPEFDLLYHNEGDGTFRDATAETGVGDRCGRGQGVLAADFNSDGLIDLYVANDLNENFLYLNAGDGTFRDHTDISGAAYDKDGQEQAGMGVDAADVDYDGHLDIFVTNYEREHNAFYRNLGNAVFQDESFSRGLGADSLPWVGWGTVLEDLDLDGWADVFVTNGHTDDNYHLLGYDSPHRQPPLVWRGHAGRFELVSDGAGDYFAHSYVGRGLAAADLDNDADLDLVVAHMDAAPALLRNDRDPRNDRQGGTARRVVAPDEPRRAAPSGTGVSPVTLAADNAPGAEDAAHWFQLRLIGRHSNRDAIGATVTIQRAATASSPARRYAWQVRGGGSYESARDYRLLVALPLPDGADGTADGPVRYECTIGWPSGGTSTCEIEPDRAYSLFEPAAASGVLRAVAERTP